MSLTIFIVCHNNGWMVRNTVGALLGRFNDTELVVIDEGSTAPRTLGVLRELNATQGVRVRHHKRNVGPKRVRRYPRYWFTRRRPFVLTDPDLDLSTLPGDTLDVLRAVADDQRLRCVGLALDISDDADLIEGDYLHGKSISEWESRFWREPADLSRLRPDLEGYWAPIDTTFAYYDFSRPRGRSIRVAGPYTVRHLPWHKSYIRALDEADYQDYFLRVSEHRSRAQLMRRFRNAEAERGG